MKGAELRQIRQQLRLTQVLFADELGLHPNTVAQLERGVLPITTTVEKLARLVLFRDRETGRRQKQRATQQKKYKE